MIHTCGKTRPNQFPSPQFEGLLHGLLHPPTSASSSKISLPEIQQKQDVSILHFGTSMHGTTR